MSGISLPTGAGELLRYFQDADRGHPDQHWKNGAMMCQWWIELIDAKHVSQSDIDSFITRLGDEENSGSGWLDLGFQFRSWAHHLGFQV